MNPNRPLHGLVLAGGRSSRMGRDKAALVHPDGRTLARRCCDLLREAGCESVVLSLRHDQEIPAGLDDIEIVRDPAGASHGPIAGIVSGMRLHPEADWLVLACDLPRLDLQTLTHLISSKRPADTFLAYRSESDALPEPLCTLYAPAALPILEQAMADDFRCPRKILIRNDCRLLEPVTSPRARQRQHARGLGNRHRAMTLTVCYYGLLAERRGLAEERVNSAAETPARLYAELDQRHQLGLAMTDFRVAVNDEFVSWDHLLSENDSIAFLPPMSGG